MAEPPSGRGPVVLEPIVLPAEAAAPPPAAAIAAPRRGALGPPGPPVRPLLQRPGQDGDDRAPPSRWWSPDSDGEDGDEDDAEAWADLERSRPSVLQYGSALGESDCLPMDHTLPHLLRQVAGTDDLLAVGSIKLRVIARKLSLQRLCLYVPNLTELNLDGSSVGSLRELGCGLSGLRVLRVTRCGLDSLDGTFGLSSLAELYAAYNRVQDIGYLACLPSIEHIDLRGNRVDDIRYAGFLTVCPYLRELVLAENPCAARAGYRATIREMLPALATLDGVALCNYQQDDETDTATEAGDDEEADEKDASVDGADMDADEAPAEPPAEPPLQEVDEGRSEAASETEESSSTSSASSRGGPVDAGRLWARAQRKAARESGLSPRTRPLLLPRPATATCATPRRPPARPHTGGGRPSPEAARPSTGDAGYSASAPAHHGAPVPDADTPSPLTSGGIVCGNLSLALRKARRRREAWGWGQPGQPEGRLAYAASQSPLGTATAVDMLSPEQERRSSGSSGSGSSGSGSAGGSCSSLSSSWSASESAPLDDAPGDAAAGGGGRPRGQQQYDADSGALLAASRKWRDAYRQYRLQNKSKWGEDAGGDGDDARPQ